MSRQHQERASQRSFLATAAGEAAPGDRRFTMPPSGSTDDPGGGGPAADAARGPRPGPLGVWLRAQRQARGWNVPEMARRLRKAAAGSGDTLPKNATLDSHIRRWERGKISPSERYKLHYCTAFGIHPDQYGPIPRPGHNGQVPEPPPGQAHPPQPAAAAAPGGQPPPCLAWLTRLVAEAIIGAVTCRCATSPAPSGPAPDSPAPASPPPASHPQPAEDATERLIIAAYRRGAGIDAIAEVCGMPRPQVRGVLKAAGIGAWT